MSHLKQPLTKLINALLAINLFYLDLSTSFEVITNSNSPHIG
ncbi:hypothetical protein PULV_b0513 [Pseudoalteromonas ulvae UL12]|nr:hypothetical protein [Pseudoalteromonas ulvae UL12]